jgi:spore germination cell wall hydrolase CwlJ-like protein
MLGSLLRKARHWLGIRRRGLAYFWLVGQKDNLAFVVMLSLPILAIAGIICFAHQRGTRIEPGGIQAVQGESTYARRRANDLRCLAENIYFEARGEPIEGQYAVAEVTLNRRWAENFPHTICEVVHETRWDPNRRRLVADFSWTELGTRSPPDGRAWQQAMAVASAAYDDLHAPVAPGALFYHATSVRPGWARNRTTVAMIGNHIFYR